VAIDAGPNKRVKERAKAGRKEEYGSGGDGMMMMMI
jgi:hypothetical protein